MSTNAGPKIGLVVSTLMEDEFNDFTSTRPAAFEALEEIKRAAGEMGKIVSLGLTETVADAERASEEFRKQDVDIILYTALSYNKGIVAAKALIKNDIPILVWNTQRLPSLSDDADWDATWTNSGLAGIPELCHTLIRAGKQFEIVTSHLEDAYAREKIAAQVRIAHLRKLLGRWRIATIGQVYPGMTDFMVDTFDLYKTFGTLCTPIEPGLVAEEMANVDQESVESLMHDTHARYQVHLDDDQALRRSVTLALAMENVVCRDAKADAVACLDQVWGRDPRIGIPPAFPYLYLYGKGVPCANEVDVTTCVALLILQFLAGNSAIVEFFDMDFDHNAVTLCHDTNGNPLMVEDEGDIVLTEAPMYAGLYGKGVICDFSYPEGDVTLLSIAQLPDGWKLIAAQGESLSAAKRPIGAPFLKFRPLGKTLANFCDRWCRAGATHHMAFAYGNWTDEIRMLAAMLGVNFSEA